MPDKEFSESNFYRAVERNMEEIRSVLLKEIRECAYALEAHEPITTSDVEEALWELKAICSERAAKGKFFEEEYLRLRSACRSF